ncbi:MAG: TRAP transporter small permease [Treponemataceae bacterium]
MSVIKRIAGFLSKLEEIFLVTCFSVIAIALFLQIIFRYFLNAPLIWTEELARYLLVWITFFGINYGLRRKKHIEMAYFFDKLPKAAQNAVTVLTQIMILYLMWKIFGATMRFVRAQMNIESSAMQINMGLVYVALPIGFITSSISILISAVKFVGELIPHPNKG